VTTPRSSIGQRSATASHGGWLLATAVTAVFTVVAVWGIKHHEIWLDEAHHWMMATHSRSLRELWLNTRYEGHPRLWNVLLFFVARFTHSVWAMQLVHVGISAAGVLLFVRYAPFSPVIRTLIPFSYFILFEYTMVSRSYGLLFLTLTATFIVLTRPVLRIWVLLLALVVLASTHLFGLFAACVIVLVLARDRARLLEVEGRPAVLVATALFSGVALVTFLTCLPPSDHFFGKVAGGPLVSLGKVARLGTLIMRGLLHVPDVRTEHFWNSNLLASSKLVSVPLSLVALAIPVVVLRCERRSLFFFYGVTGLVGGFLLFTRVPPATRYFGMIFLTLLFARWMAVAWPGRSTLESGQGTTMAAPWPRWSDRLLIVLLVLQCGAGGLAYAGDLRRPFSRAKDVAAFITRSHDGAPVLVSPHCVAPPLAAYLDRPVYFIENHDLRAFCLWNTDPFIATDQQVVSGVREYLRRTGIGQGVLVTDHRLPAGVASAAPELSLAPLGVFGGAVVQAENYFVYAASIR
jgi:hypothetical protein